MQPMIGPEVSRVREHGQDRSDVASRVAMDLHFTKPKVANNKVLFTLTPAGNGVDVNWAMTELRLPAQTVRPVLQHGKNGRR